MVFADALATHNRFVEVMITVLALFLLGAMIGYGIEVLFRRFCSAKKWVNPGFMKGPWLPLYGFGVLSMFFFCYLTMTFMPSQCVFYNPLGGLFGKDYVSGPTVYDLIPISIMAVGLILLEFVAGMIFVKGFKVRLWDYTNMKGNIQGVICPVFNVVWTVAAIGYYYLLNPFVHYGFTQIFLFLFGDGNAGAHFGSIFTLGLVYGIFLIDLVQSIGLFSRVRKFADASGMIDRYEKLREETRKVTTETKNRFFDALPEVFKKSKEEDGKEKLSDKVIEKAKQAILIDPNAKKTTKDNYDENGRPKKEE